MAWLRAWLASLRAEPRTASSKFSDAHLREHAAQQAAAVLDRLAALEAEAAKGDHQ